MARQTGEAADALVLHLGLAAVAIAVVDAAAHGREHSAGGQGGRGAHHAAQRRGRGNLYGKNGVAGRARGQQRRQAVSAIVDCAARSHKVRELKARSSGQLRHAVLARVRTHAYFHIKALQVIEDLCGYARAVGGVEG